MCCITAIKEAAESFETIVYEMKDGVAKLHQEFGEARHRPAVSGNAQGARSKGFEKVLAVCRRERRTVVLEHEARLALERAGVETAASPSRRGRCR